MNDPALFNNFLQEAGLTVARARNEMLSFVDTFQSLLATNDNEINDFVKNTHSSNSARAANSRILIPPGTIIALQAILFELKDRERCDALPNEAMLGNLDREQITFMRAQRTQALHDEEQNKLATLATMKVPKLSATNYDTFNTAFTAVAARKMGTNGTTLDYLMRKTNGNYESPWDSREDKLKQCTRLAGPNFRKDRESLYSLFVEHVGTESHGSNIVNKFKTSKDGYRCYHEFDAHFRNDAYLENKATIATQAMNAAVYRGDRKNFSLETYYSIMSNAFNDLSQAGASHSLNDHQKITKFEQGLKETTAISWAITAKNHWNTFPADEQTFDSFYNEFSKYMTKFKTLNTPDIRQSRISALGSSERGRGRGRGYRGGRGRGGRGRGRYGRGGRGRGRYGYNPYSMSRNYNSQESFTPVAKMYTSEEWQALNPQQRRQIHDLKASQGWINGQTPPPGFTIQDDGSAAPSSHLVAAVRQSMIGNTNTSNGSTMIPLPPPPPPIVPGIPPIINTNPSQAGASFGRRGTHNTNQQQENDNNTVSNVSMISINGRNYNGAVFDANGNRIA